LISYRRGIHLIYTILIIFILIGILIYVGYYFSKIVMYPKVIDYDETYKMELDQGNISKGYFESLPKEEISIESSYGYKLHGFWIPNKNSKKTMVFCHGITHSLFGSIKYVDIFYSQGFNVLVYDHRFHGKSEGNNATFGYHEKYDLKTCIDWVMNKLGKDSLVGTHGESMGAATVLQHAAIDNRVSFVIADCPYESAREEFVYRLRVDHKLPPFPLLNIASLINKVKTGAFYKDMCPIRHMPNLETPILFIHGDADTYIPCSHSINLYNSKKGVKELYVAKGAKHASSILVDRNKYEEVVDTFLRNLNII
jgi:uncharacterized protein